MNNKRITNEKIESIINVFETRRKNPILKLIIFFIGIFGTSQVIATNISLLSIGVASEQNEITGSGYAATTVKSTLITGQYSRLLSSRWRGHLSGAGSYDGDILSVSSGISYHFLPILHEIEAPNESVEYLLYSKWSPYVGAELGFTRVQLTLERTNTESAQTDAIVGALTGPTIRGGTFMILNREWLLNLEFTLAYAFSTSVASSAQSYLLQLSYMFP